MTAFLETFINIAVAIASIWAGGNVLVSIGMRWQTLNAEKSSENEKILECQKQIAAIWKRVDSHSTVTDQRLDKLDREIAYIAGSCRVNLPSSTQTPPWEIDQR